MQNRGKVSQLHTAYSQQVFEEEQSKDALRKQLMTIRKKRFYGIISVFLVFVLFFGIQIIQSKASLHHVNTQITQSQTKLKNTKKQNTKLAGQVKLLNDDDYLQKVIRQKYYYAKDGETVYNLPTSEKTMNTANQK
jgi:cell division protein DivIC